MTTHRYATKLKTVLFLGVFVLGLGSLSPLFAATIHTADSIQSTNRLESTSIPADDYHSNHNLEIPGPSHTYVYWNLGYGDGIYGNFEVVDETISFFICDQANYDLWDSGQTASVYHLQEVVTSYSFHFIVPYSDTWYFVFQNKEFLITKTVNFDLYKDLTPPSIDMSIDAGATYSGIKEITATINEAQFDIESVHLYIDGTLVDTEYDGSFSYSWDTSRYSNGAHTIRISADDNVGNSGFEEITVQVYNAILPFPGGGDPGSSNTVMILAIVGIVAFVGVVGIVGRARRSSPDSLTGTGALGTSLSTSDSSSHVKEREVVSERFLVICPFCGSKNEQGTIQCSSCGAKL